jgi:DNA-binding GntR family transcriptional regulator
VTSKLRSIEKPIQLAELAYEALRDSILNGLLKPGDIVNEIPMAKEMGISRTPVREALLELSSQGLVEILPRRGVRIKYFTEQDVHEVCEIRELIELGVVEKAAQSGTPFAHSKPEQALEMQRDAVRVGDVPEFLRADRLFHIELISLSGNRRLPKILQNLRDLIDVMAQRALTRSGRMEEVLLEHQAVVDCIKQGKVMEAKDALRHHLQKTKHAVLERIKRGSQDLEAQASKR